MANTTKTVDGIEVYQHDILMFADQYIADVLQADDTAEDGRRQVRESFPAMILYIADRIQRPNKNDIELLDNIFNIYIRLCCKYSVLPTLEIFSFLVSINNATFTDWINKEYRVNIYRDTDGCIIDNIKIWLNKHPGEEYSTEPSVIYSKTVKKWKETCKSFVINRLHNQTGTNANLIFTAKAAYGMTEAPQQIEIKGGQLPTRTAAEIAAGRNLAELPEPEKPEI